MTTKRKTLPKDFQELIDNGDIEKLKGVFDKCDVNAHERYAFRTALCYPNIPDELVKWLVEQGADINIADKWNDTPIMYQIRNSYSGTKDANIDLYLDLGADINCGLYAATYYCMPKMVKKLIDRGADVNGKHKMGYTPLEYGLRFCSNAHIVGMAEIVDYYLGAGAEVTENVKDFTHDIGENFERYRDSFNKEYLDETDRALKHLYECFNAVPAAMINKHDGVSTITVKSKRWQDQFNEFWDFLVPGSGYAKTVQGEVIRIAGKVSHEILDNGGMNWDKDYNKMIQSLLKYVKNGAALGETDIKEMSLLISHIHDCSEKMMGRLTELGVKWVISNPDPILMEKPEYSR